MKLPPFPFRPLGAQRDNLRSCQLLGVPTLIHRKQLAVTTLSNTAVSFPCMVTTWSSSEPLGYGAHGSPRGTRLLRKVVNTTCCSTHSTTAISPSEASHWSPYSPARQTWGHKETHLPRGSRWASVVVGNCYFSTSWLGLTTLFRNCPRLSAVIRA